MASSTPVLFIHGLWLHARSWDSWIEHFKAAGYADSSAPGWPGDPDSVEEARKGEAEGRALMARYLSEVPLPKRPEERASLSQIAASKTLVVKPGTSTQART